MTNSIKKQIEAIYNLTFEEMIESLKYPNKSLVNFFATKNLIAHGLNKIDFGKLNDKKKVDVKLMMNFNFKGLFNSISSGSLSNSEACCLSILCEEELN